MANPLYRFLYRLYRIFSWLKYQGQRRLTAAGLSILGALILTMITGSDTENNVGYQAFALLMSLLLIALVFGVSFRVRFSAVRLLPRFGTVGCPLRYKVAVTNLTSKVQSGLALLENLADPRPSFQEWLTAKLDEQRQLRSFRFGQVQRTSPFKPAKLSEASLPSVPPNSTLEVEMEMMPLHRGLVRFTGTTLARPDPLGLWRSYAKVPLPQSALILPKRYALPPMALPGTLRYQQGGVALASSVGQSEEFVSLRDYRQGDPLRHIHWRSWAKTGKPVVKEFEDEFFVRHALVLDTFARYAHSDVFEEAVSVAASFACTLQTQESLLDLLFVGPKSFCFTAGRGLAHADQMLEILASVRPCREQPFSSLERLVLEHIQAVSGCICVLVAWTEDRRQFVEKLQGLGVPVRVLVIVEAGQSESIKPGPMREELDHFQVLEAGKIEQGLATPS